METYDRDLHTHGIEEYEMQERPSGRGFPFGLVLGVIVGSVLGLFLAPKSGQALREELSDPKTMFEDQKDKIVDTAKEKKAEYEEVERIKDTDDETMSAQQRAIKEEARDNDNTVDMSKYN